MKRRAATSPRDFPRRRTSSVRGFNGRPDTLMNRRVKLTEREIDPPLCDELTESSERHEAAKPRGSDAPKTSEYAFFKKLKKDACCRSSIVCEEDEHLRTLEPSGSSSTKDFSTKFKDSFDKITSSIHHEKAGLNFHESFSPPQSNALKSPEAAQVIEDRHNDINPPFLAKRVKFADQHILLSPHARSSEKSGSEDLDVDMLNQKRKRLRQWVAETSGPEVENLCSKGHDLVSALLSRLFPDENQSKYFRDTEAKCSSNNTKYSADEFLHEDSYGEKYLWSRPSDFTRAEPLSYLDDFRRTNREIIPLKLDSDLLNSLSTRQFSSDKFLLEDTCGIRSHWIKNRDYIETDHARYLDDSYNETTEMIPLNPEARFPNSSFGCPHHFQYENNKSYFSSDDRNASSLALCEPYYSSDVHGSSSSSHIKDGNRFYAFNESGYRRELGVMLLDWDFANLQDKGDLSHTLQDKEMNLLSTRVASSYDRQRGVREPHSILFNSDYHYETTLCRYSHLEKLSWDPTLFKQDTMLVAKPKQYPLPLTYVPECLEEDRNSYISFEANEGLSLQHNNFVVSKFLSEKQHPELKPLLSGQGVDTYLKCLSSSNLLSPQKKSIYSYLLTDEEDNFLGSSQNTQRSRFCAEDTINILEWPSHDLDKPLRNEMICSFLLESSPSWLQSEEDDCYGGD